MARDDTPLTRGEFAKFADDLIEGLNTAFRHIYRRLDDIERRMEKLEGKAGTMQSDISDIRSNMHYVKNDTKMIRPMFELIRMDGAEMGELKGPRGEPGKTILDHAHLPHFFIPREYARRQDIR